MAKHSQAFMYLRAERTYQCMNVIKLTAAPPWEYSEFSVLQFKERLDGVAAKRETWSDEAADTAFARSTRNEQFAALQDRGSAALKQLRIKYRKDNVRLPLLQAVTLNSESMSGKLADALKFSSVWQKVNPAWVAEDGLELGDYDDLRAALELQMQSVSKEGAEEASAGGELSVAFEELHDWSVAWYGVATEKYKEETPFGIMIRRHIPTAPASGAATLPGKAVLTAEAGIGQVNLTVTAPGAETYTIWYRAVGTEEWLEVVVGHTSGSFLQTGVPVGSYEYRAMGHNFDGDGEASDIVTVEVT